MQRMNAIDWVAYVLVIVGGLNWGLVGLFDWNLVAALFGTASTLSRIIYTLVGLATVYSLIRMFSRADTRERVTQ